MPPYTATDSIFHISVNQNEQYQIREMTMTDIPSIIPIDQETWDEQSWPPEEFIQIMTDPCHSCWVLECLTNDYPIAGYGFQRVTYGNSHITNLCVHPEYRGRGLGEILLTHMINHARSLAIPKIELEVSTCNIPAYNLYTKHGFIVNDLLENYYSDADDAYHMELFFD